MPDSLLGLLGLCRRAGKLAAGFDAVLKAAEKGSAFLVLSASDASERTVRAVREGGAEPVQTPFTMAQIGAAIGRSETAVLAICDRSMANRVKTLFHA